jgi:probable O-glycosylation ligase (exosortase A-associated)
MLRSIWLLFVFVAFLGLGATVPFVATLGYVWVDTFQPQFVAYIILNQLPVSLIMGLAAFGTYFMFDRRNPPPMNLQTFLQIAMLIWTSATMLWAQLPDLAYMKFDVVWKTLLFAAFVPFVIRSRVQLEAFAQTYVFSLAANFVPFGAKVILSGGGYGVNLGLQSGNSGLSEGGLLSTVCLMAVPLALYLGKHGQLLPRWKIVTIGYWGIAALAVICAIGTYERSALVGLVVLTAYMWVRSRNKFLLGFAVIVGACLLIYTSSSGWDSRISTIDDYQNDGSAIGRLQVWTWTLGFVATHPFGGGFNCYALFGRAFHSIYFEVLGEHGYPGLAIFLLLIVSTYVTLHRTGKRASQYPELMWIREFSDALQSGIAVFLSAGAFIGIAFQPPFWYFVAMTVSLRAYLIRAEGQEKVASWVKAGSEPLSDAIPAQIGWRARAGNASAGSPRRWAGRASVSKS